MTTFVIDESGDDFEDVHRYVIGAGVVLQAAGRLDAVRREAEGLLMATENRSRAFHWLKEGPHLRLAMIDLIGRLVTTEPAGPAPRVTPKHTASPSILRDAGVGSHSITRAGSRDVYMSGITGRSKPISSTRFHRFN